MTVSEAAKILEVSPDLVYRLCSEGRLSHHRVGIGRGVVRITDADLRDYIASTRSEAEPIPTTTAARPVARRAGSAIAAPGIVEAALARKRLRAASRRS